MLFRRRNREIEAEGAYVDDTVNTWNRACSLAGLTRSVPTASGETEVIPRLEFVGISERFLTVRLLPGQLPEDISAVGRRLAHALGATSIRVEPRGTTHVIVRLLDHDPVGDPYNLPEGPLTGPVLLARDEAGDITADPSNLGHMAIQGRTGSGKSVALYGLLAQLSGRSEVDISGVDPSGMLLRPFPTSVLGLSDPFFVEAYLQKQVDFMDSRIRQIPVDRDRLDVDDRNRGQVIVMEELPGLWRWMDAADSKAAKRCRALLARLLAEGRKAGFAVVLVAQRFEANVVGGFERGQCTTRISFAVDNLDAVRLLHLDAGQDTASAHTTEQPGVALVSTTGRPLSRARFPFLSYADYVRAVQP